MSPKQKQELRRQSDEFSFGEAAGAASGGMIKRAAPKSLNSYFNGGIVTVKGVK